MELDGSEPEAYILPLLGRFLVRSLTTRLCVPFCRSSS